MVYFNKKEKNVKFKCFTRVKYNVITKLTKPMMNLNF